jgi:hypothetical protein
MVYSDYDSNQEAEAGSGEDYSHFRDIWQPPVEHGDVHSDVGAYDESILKRLKSER